MSPVVSLITVMLLLFSPTKRGASGLSPIRNTLRLGNRTIRKSLEKNKSSVKVIEVNNHEIKVAQYADDTTVFVRDGESVLELLNFLEEF